MIYAILGGLLVLLVAGLAAAVAAAARARRELVDLEEEFAEHRGVAFEHESEVAPWTSIDLDDLREDVTEVAGHDPYATLTGADPAVSWHALGPNGSETGPNLWEPEPNGGEPKPTADQDPTVDLAPIENLRSVAWRPTVDAPIIVLVVGAGFLGTGMSASVTTAGRLQRAWGEMNESFAQTGVITLDSDAEPAAPPSHDPEPTRDDVTVAEPAAPPYHDPEPTRDVFAEPAARPSYDPTPTRDDVTADDAPHWPRSRRRSVDPFPPPRDVDPFPPPRDVDPFPPPREDDLRMTLRERANRLRSQPSTDPPPREEDGSRMTLRERANRLRSQHTADPPPREEDDSRISPRQRANRLRPKPTADPKPIAWRPPTTRR
jgi:hypothetical protein